MIASARSLVEPVEAFDRGELSGEDLVVALLVELRRFSDTHVVIFSIADRAANARYLRGLV